MAILEKFANLFKLNVPSLVSTIFSNYTKRVAENKYDDVMETNVGEYLKNLSPEKKKLTELAMYFFTGVFEQKFPENTAVRKYFKSVLSDSGSEVAKRMINGAHDDLQKIPLTVEKRVFADLLCELDEEALKKLVENLCGMDAKERKNLIQELTYLDPQKLEKIAGLNAEDFQKLSTTLQPPQNFWEREAKSIETALRNYVNSTPPKEEKK